IKKLIPKKLLNLRHLFFAWLGAVKYSHPSEELMVIGITGTSGKSTTAYLLRQILEAAGFKVGSLSTIDFYVAGEEKLNDQKMTMLGKMQIQKYLREMVNKKCDVAIVETTSEGRVQYRHKFINYDMMLLTNLYPEHIDSHGSFEAYKKAKLDVFEYVANHKSKIINQKSIGKTTIVNGNSEYKDEFLEFNFEKKIIFGTNISKQEVKNDGLYFNVDDKNFHAPLYGEHNISNIVAALAIAREFNIDWDVLQKAVSQLKSIPGRVEFIAEAEEKGFQAIVDYAFEPVAMEKLYQVVDLLKPIGRIIHVFGSTGGGRDKERRFKLGEMIGKRADICIVTDEDPYEDDPQEIINDVAGAVIKQDKELNKNVFKILDRKEAIGQAIEMARAGDLILITGKGSEQGMCVAGGKMIAWDDRNFAREFIAKK
ncbi:MAG: UDP-N-acetylmuramyl-tripeptide synthetase, partial [Patescibacteria group bacterium]|nr:UDP-N-acetylmuramyl-tripeptide synthetase [Patescibacteria group bacterium]